MAVKKCCIKSCKSCSTRKEDKGVTYHKFPKNALLCKTWANVTRYKFPESLTYVCSRHFRKSDFKVNEDTKYVLNSDAVPSIFPWSVSEFSKMENIENLGIPAAQEHVDDHPNISENVANLSETSKESEENVDAIKKFIDDHTKEIEDQKLYVCNTPHEVDKKHDDSLKNTENLEMKISTNTFSSNVMDMILSETDENLTQKKFNKDLAQQSLIVNTVEKLNNSISLSVGSKVLAKDYSDNWYEAEIIEVDYDEMEVLVRYEQSSKKHDEWVSLSSPRLRPVGSAVVKLESAAQEVISEPVVLQEEEKEIKNEKAYEKFKSTFEVGERCLARWRDNRRFVATINSDLGNGTYEVLFDDGFYWKCSKNRLYKWKPEKFNPLTIDTSLNSSVSSIHSPIQSGGPTINPSSLPVFHTHLFDPTRDYLGSKSERREMKRKLNIKEIFNIGQKKSKIRKIDKEKSKVVAEKKPKVLRKTPKTKTEAVLKKKVKVDLNEKMPVSVASIIGTVNQEDPVVPENDSKDHLQMIEKSKGIISITDNIEDSRSFSNINDTTEDDTLFSEKVRFDLDPIVLEEEVKLEKFEKQDEVKYGEVIDRMKEAINKLEDGIKHDQANASKTEIKEQCDLSVKEEVKEETIIRMEKIEEDIAETSTKPTEQSAQIETENKDEKKLSKIKKGRKLRLLREKKVKKQVERVKNELEEMKKQVDEMRKQMLMKSQELAKGPTEMPASFLLPGEWCCRWVNGQPVGTVSEIPSEQKIDGDGTPALPRRSVQVEDTRLPPGWTKHMVRRSLGHSAGKWDVVLVSPENRRFHTKNELRAFLENNPNEALIPYEFALMDFGVHLKLARRMGWISNTPEGVADGPSFPLSSIDSTSPLVKKTKLSLKKQKKIKEKRKKFILKMKFPRPTKTGAYNAEQINPRPSISKDSGPTFEMVNVPPLEDGYVYVGSLKVQIIENLLRCPAEGCFKNFRNNTLLKMHIKHYHRELRKMLGATPKVLDLAYARTMPNKTEVPSRLAEPKVLKVKINRLPKREEPKQELNEISPETYFEVSPSTPISSEVDNIPKQQDSPKLRNALVNKPVKRPKVLLPVRRPEPEITSSVPENSETLDVTADMETNSDLPIMEPLDFETAISTHTVTKPFKEKKKKEKKGDKKKKSFAIVSQKQSEEDDWFTGNSDYESHSSYPGSGTPDSKSMDRQLIQQNMSETALQPKQKSAKSYMYNENGERIKLVRMKREEIINCHCGFREEDGLMVQCELCLCWQHALCYNIDSEVQVPEKYTCSICLNPVRGRRSKRFLHDQDRMYEGLLPGAKPCDSLRRSHELSGNLLLIKDTLHALRIKSYVATKKNHPKLYLWAQDWNQAEITNTQEKLNSGYSDLNIVPSVPHRNIKSLTLMRDVPLDVSMSPSDDLDAEEYSHRDSSNMMLGGLMSTTDDPSLDFTISTSELEQLATTVQALSAPQPEAPIENGVCREQLLRHVQRCQALVDARLDSIEAQVAELESQDPTVEGDDTADHFPRTKQTVRMLMRDLNALEELGVIT